MEEKGAGRGGELCLHPLRVIRLLHREAVVRSLPWGEAMQNKDGKRQLEEGTVSIFQISHPGLSPQDTGELAGGWVVKKQADFSSSCGHQ